MARSLLSKNLYRALIASIALVVLVFLAGLQAGAQKRRRPAGQPNAIGATVSTRTPQNKSITPLRVVETPEGSRVTITSDAPLNDYSAYRSGDRFFVVIPQADAPRLLNALRGRGFEDVQVQKRGNDVVLSFRLQAGATARVDQKFNRLEILFTLPGKLSSAGTTRIDSRPPLITPTNTNTGNQNVTGTGAQNSSITPPANENATTIAGTSTRGRRGGRRNWGAWPSYTYAESETGTTATTEGAQPTASATPAASVSPSPTGSASVTPSATPTEQQVAQTQTAPPPPPQTATTTTSNQPAPETRTLGATLKENWLLVLLGVLVLLIIGWVLTARSRGGRAAETAETITEEKALKEGAVESPITRAAPASEAASLDEATLAAPVAEAAAVEQAREVESSPALAEEVESKQIEPATAVDVERADAQVNSLLAGESYDESVIGAADAGTRQIIAAGLLAALAGRNEERRERARQAFIKHDYFNEATRHLRTADAPAERASAARSLGLARDRAATPHLVAALEDPSPEVRRAAVEALAEIRDPQAHAPLEALLNREKDRKVPKGLIHRAIEASAPTAAEEETTAPSAPVEETPTVEAAPVVAAEGAPPAEAPAIAETEEVETETVKAPSVETTEIPALETAVQPEALDTTPEPERAEAEAPPVSTADVSGDESASALGTLAAATPIIAAGALAAEELAARKRAKEEEEAQRRAEEEAQRRAEEEARVRAEEERKRAAEEEARRRAEEEAARKRAEEEARQRAEEERRQAEEEARRREAEAARQRAEEEARQRAAEEERRRVEEEQRRRAEEEAARQREEAEAARRRAEEEAERQRAEAELARMRAEAEATRPRSEEELKRRQIIRPDVAASLAGQPETTEPAPTESMIERNDGTAAGWVEVDITEPEVVRHATPIKPTSGTPAEEEKGIAQVTPEPITAEPVEETFQQRVAPEAIAPEVVEQPRAESETKEIDQAVVDKGIAPVGEDLSTVPSAILKRLGSEDESERAAAVSDLSRLGGDDSFREITAAFDDPSQDVRNAAARSLYNLHTDRAATFTRALREAPPERRRAIGAALASSGLANEAISHLMGESREKTYDAFSLLFLMSKAGEVQPLLRAIEEHPNNEVRLAVVKLLALSGQQEILPAFRRLAVRGSLPTEVRSAVMEAIYQISSQSSPDTSSAA